VRVEHVKAAQVGRQSGCSSSLCIEREDALVLRYLGLVPLVAVAVLKADRTDGHLVDADTLDPPGRVEVGRALRARIREARAR
jgi:hypothetical protein